MPSQPQACPAASIVASESGAESPGSDARHYDSQRRRKTDSSYYCFDGIPSDRHNPNSQTWMYARDAREQQKRLPAGRVTKYPSVFKNHRELAFSTPGSDLRGIGKPEHLHFPLVPGQSTSWKPRKSTSWEPRGHPSHDGRGGIRSIYTAGSPLPFDVIYHDPRLERSPKGSEEFSLAKYYPKVLSQPAPAPAPPTPSTQPSPPPTPWLTPLAPLQLSPPSTPFLTPVAPLRPSPPSTPRPAPPRQVGRFT